MRSVILIVGARPQFIKASPLCSALSAAGCGVKILHTGQHFDTGMSDVFFKEFSLPAPEWNLGFGGGPHGSMTGAMLTGIESVLMEETPDCAVVFGDTNSTLAGALAAAKLHLCVAHVEAGLRSGNRRMPEELNRICTDHLSDLLFCSSEAGRVNLAAEGITRGVEVTGDIMADVFHQTLDRARAAAPVESAEVLLTLHRAENTDDPARLRGIVEALRLYGAPVIFPVHPRTRRALDAGGIPLPSNVRCTDPVGYSEMVKLLDACRVVLTDSGGLQKEAYWAGKPCIVLRDETEWTELTSAGWAVLTGANTAAILAALANPPVGTSGLRLYGDGRAAQVIAASILSRSAA